jgi:hypothetical protein
LEAAMFDNLFVEMGRWGSSVALLLVVAIPAAVAATATIHDARLTIGRRWRCCRFAKRWIA